MIDEQRIKEARDNVRVYLSEGLLYSKNKENTSFIDFFLDNSLKSLQTADLLYSLSETSSTKKLLKMDEGFESYLWVTVCSYYSMFYSTLALLATKEYKVGRKNIHKVVADTLITILSDKKELSQLLQDYDELKDEAITILIKSYEAEREKRSKFQYETGYTAKKNYAQTSLQRAKEFVHEIRKIIKK